ncbi:unnamed protein product [Spirodela intermedia]|uniref:Uncharacterized protein n=1 Tax=Spirodela intermedia TaxID=51605 RepID=A0A7I8LJ55_SPIIN|nr:unnamed protein product [Spirodela intermedia]
MRPQRKEQAFEMTIRENAFPEDTQWSEGEARVMKEFWTQLVQVLSPDIIFIADPEGTIIGGSSVVPQFLGQSTAEMRLVGALREVLTGGHLGFEEVQGVLKDVLPLEETDRELKAYCLAFDGEPETSLLHGVDWMPPKGVVREEQMLKFMGSNTHLSPLQAKKLLNDENVGLAYVSQREACPSLDAYICSSTLEDHLSKSPLIWEKKNHFHKPRCPPSPLRLPSTLLFSSIPLALHREHVYLVYHERYPSRLRPSFRRRHAGQPLPGSDRQASASFTDGFRERSHRGIPLSIRLHTSSDRVVKTTSLPFLMEEEEKGTPTAPRSIQQNDSEDSTGDQIPHPGDGFPRVALQETLQIHADNLYAVRKEGIGEREREMGAFSA